MIYSEMCVWVIAILLNLYFVFFNVGIYDKSPLLTLFRQILLNPFPFWSIIILSAIGTYLSIYFGDELMDVVKNKQRKKFMKHKLKHRIVLVSFVVLSHF